MYKVYNIIKMRKVVVAHVLSVREPGAVYIGEPLSEPSTSHSLDIGTHPYTFAPHTSVFVAHSIVFVHPVPPTVAAPHRQGAGHILVA